MPDTPIIKRNVEVSAFRQWIVNKRPLGKVIPLEFIEFHYKQDRFRQNRPNHFYDREGNPFIGEVWRCLSIKTGQEVICKFRHPVLGKNDRESSLYDRHDAINDRYEANLLIDRIEEFYDKVDKNSYPNKHLIRENNRFKKRLEVLRNMFQTSTGLKKKCLFLLLRHKQTPCISTLSTLNDFKAKNPDIYNEVIQEAQFTINEKSDLNYTINVTL